MSDEPTPALRDLAAKLFAAGRAERPAPALGRRLMLIEPPLAVRPRTSTGRDAPLDIEGEPTAESARRQRASRLAFWFAAAAVLAAGVSSWLALEPDLARVTISAEITPIEVVRQDGSRASGAEPVAESPRAESLGVEPLARGKKHRPGPRAPVSGTSASRPAVGSRPMGTGAELAPAATQSARAPASQPASGAERAEAAGESAPRAADPPMTLLEEIDLIKRARGALRSGHPAHALELLERRASRGLAAEATLLRIETYAALGRHGEASELASRFVRENPSSALGDRAKSFIHSVPPTSKDRAPATPPGPSRERLDQSRAP